ncbi:hypothetical protein FH5T_16925 [Draconibacterium orientale]|uniref:Uncharacterized protein n=1 Tax=Draconibacterium orientale TaxID=1168034 RepID=A0ABN4D7J9_9BACT|nr:hypothetical protein FH5T_16925 [Draconibacterium orientale]
MILPHPGKAGVNWKGERANFALHKMKLLPSLKHINLSSIINLASVSGNFQQKLLQIFEGLSG